MATRGKRRFKSQRIGREGELLFERWATRNHLSANKLSDDYGVDYHCQELEPISRSSEEVTGRSVLVQVRATSGDSRARISLSREDVETALRHASPYCVAAVHMPSETVHFRFLDVTLAEEWSTFLAGKNESTSLRIDKMEVDRTRFLEELKRVTRPAFMARLAEAKARIAIERDLPGANLHLNLGLAGNWALVAMPHVGHAFDVKTPHEQADLARTVFKLAPAQSAYVEALRRFALKASVRGVSKLTDGPLFIAGGVEDIVVLEVRKSESVAVADAKLRHVAGERAYLLESGLVFKISDPRKDENGKYVHDLDFSIVFEGAASLGTTSDIEFLRALQRGSKFNELGRPGLPIEAFGLNALGESVITTEKVCTAVGLALAEVRLADLADEAFAHNLGFLEAMLLSENRPIPLPSFVIGLGPDEPIQKDAWKPCFYKVPVVLRLKNRSLIVWLSGEGAVYVPDDLVQGFRFGPPSAVETEDADFEVADGIATASLVAGWPRLPINAQDKASGSTSSAAYPVVGEYRWTQPE